LDPAWLPRASLVQKKLNGKSAFVGGAARIDGALLPLH
jgi:hypothetical protein